MRTAARGAEETQVAASQKLPSGLSQEGLLDVVAHAFSPGSRQTETSRSPWVGGQLVYIGHSKPARVHRDSLPGEL